MKKICILATSCTTHTESFYKIINSCKEKYEIVRSVEEADWCIFHFCSGTDTMISIHEEELEFILGRKKREAKIIVTGCITFVNESKKEFLKKYPIDYIVQMENQIEEICKILGVEPNESIYNEYEVINSVIIGDGCLNKCAFCRVHYCNRPLKSLTMEVIENKIKDIVEKGVRLININSLNTAQYGIDIYGKKMLHILLKRISKIKGLEGIIVNALSISDIYDELAKEITENDLIIDVCMDIQSGSDRLLKLMNVGHTVEDIQKYFTLFKNKVNYARIISGFPTETEQDVKETINLLKSLDVYTISLQEYINSKDVPSGKMKQLSEENFENHLKMYKEFISKKEEENFEKYEGKEFVGYVFDFSIGKIRLYCQELGFVNLILENIPFDLNLNDKVLVQIHNKGYKLIKMLESCGKETVVSGKCKSEMFQTLNDIYSITSDLTIPYYKACEYLDGIFEMYGGNSLSEEEFKVQISNLPKELQDALLRNYKISNM